MSGELVGFAVMGRQPDLSTHEILAYTLESAVFCDSVQADNAHTYLVSKRDAKKDFIVVEIHSGTSQEQTMSGLTDRITEVLRTHSSLDDDVWDRCECGAPTQPGGWAAHVAERVEAELQLTAEKRVKYREPAHDAHLGNVSCDCGDTINTASPYVTAEPDGSLWHGNKQGGGHKSNFDRKKERRWVSAWTEVES